MDFDRLDFETVADELYGLEPAEFTARRNEREKEARSAGDRELAGRIKALRRPSIGAWVANMLVRAHRDEVEALLALGGELARAQVARRADEIRELSRRRQQTVSSLVRRAKAVAAEQGREITDDVAGEVDRTLVAALSDPDSADALRQGRLTTGLEYAGFGPMPLSAVPSTEPSTESGTEPGTESEPAAGKPAAEPGPAEKPAPSSTKAPKRPRTGRTAVTDLAEQRKRRQFEQAEYDADAAARAAESAVESEQSTRVAAERAREWRDQVAERVAELREAMKEATVEMTKAERELDKAERAHERSERAVKDTARRRDAADKRLAGMRDEG